MSAPSNPSCVLALTQGDPSGIGLEIALKAYAAAHVDAALPRFFLVADPAHVARVAAQLMPGIAIIETVPENAAAVFETALPVVPMSARVKHGEPGKPHRDDAASTIQSITDAVALVKAGRARAIVTNPIAKAPLYAAGFAHPGHTEYLAALTADAQGIAPRPVMLLWSPTLAVVPITIHVPLASVLALLTQALIVETARIADHDLRARFGIAKPRLAFAGLNPHAGEGGTIGREEIDIIAPAIAQLVREGIDARGPFSADTLFHAAARAKYDVALCMTHDQALIPIKTLAFDSGVNVTLGLPFVRTSPDHGTAFDIAGRNIANPESLIEALKLASRLAP